MTVSMFMKLSLLCISRADHKIDGDGAQINLWVGISALIRTKICSMTVLGTLGGEFRLHVFWKGRTYRTLLIRFPGWFSIENDLNRS